MRFKAAIPAVVRLLILGIALALVCSACGGGTETGAIEASGTIEAEEVIIASEFGGRVADVLAEEGDEVEASDVLIRLDTSLVDAQMGEAEAAVAAARANLARVQAGPRPGEITTAEAMLEQAIAARDGAERAWRDAQAVRDNPQQLNAQIDEASAQVELAERQVAQAQAQLRSLEIERNSYAGAGDDESKTAYEALDQQVKAAEAAVAIAGETLEGAKAHLENLMEMRDRPIALNTTVNQARAQYEQAVAAAEVGQASLDALLAKPTEEEVAIAQAQVSQAEATLTILQVQLDKMTLRSPLSGLVSNRAIHVGETASPGATLMTVANLDEVELTVYIPENRYGRIQLGQPVGVEVDSFPGTVYEGKVTYISSQAEFTPRNVQTQEERVSTVFAVKILIANPEHDLKPGMPADASIAVE
ncbi:MAG: HlyD family efflux transporter periplasmic adaptor subunit [Anaerolineae bacterium]|nr:HlyD family efflux transporter periplasmic adaptor subunit [Anaerolineae bacterium]NIN99502.1 HlyD family efflux transporter periplasmic adaptor subunit [Anaerolineae bacterium]NIQ82366.1 HlyD family efflux transporter periplasmic adaptor subunit [Anaerolineae bacterium]